MQPSDKMHVIGQTLLRVVKPDMTPEQLMKAVRKDHPNASKKDIAQAAFYTVIENAAMRTPRGSRNCTRLP